MNCEFIFRIYWSLLECFIITLILLGKGRLHWVTQISRKHVRNKEKSDYFWKCNLHEPKFLHEKSKEAIVLHTFSQYLSSFVLQFFVHWKVPFGGSVYIFRKKGRDDPLVSIIWCSIIISHFFYICRKHVKLVMSIHSSCLLWPQFLLLIFYIGILYLLQWE